TVTDLTPVITVTKSGPASIRSEERSVGKNFTITAASTNASTDAVTITQVSDNKLGDLTADALAANNGNAIVLQPGGSFSFSVTRTLTVDAKDGSFTNMVTATGTDDENNSVSDDDTHTATVTDLTPVITVTKSGPASI